MQQSRPLRIAEVSNLRVGVIGRGAIGRVVADSLTAGKIPGVVLAGVLRRDASAADEVGAIDGLLALGCDVVVEAAGHDALREYGAAVLESGSDLVALSAGCLADPVMEEALRSAGPGRLQISTGAIGGLDIARALMESGSLESVSIRSMTTPASLADKDGAEADSPGSETVLVRAGSAREVALGFPRLTNIVATAALATVGLDAARAELWVDPSGTRKQHVLSLEARESRVRVEIENVLSGSNARTSALTPYSVLRLLRDRVEPFAAGV